MGTQPGFTEGSVPVCVFPQHECAEGVGQRVLPSFRVARGRECEAAGATSATVVLDALIAKPVVVLAGVDAVRRARGACQANLAAYHFVERVTPRVARVHRGGVLGVEALVELLDGVTVLLHAWLGAELHVQRGVRLHTESRPCRDIVCFDLVTRVVEVVRRNGQPPLGVGTVVLIGQEDDQR